MIQEKINFKYRSCDLNNMLGSFLYFFIDISDTSVLVIVSLDAFFLQNLSHLLIGITKILNILAPTNFEFSTKDLVYRSKCGIKALEMVY